MKIRRFITPWWMRNRHIQTSWGAFFRSDISLEITSQRVLLRDGHSLFADFKEAKISSEAGQEPTTICILLHGLTGSASSHYVRGIQKNVHELIPECASFAVNHRGSLGHECPSLESPVLYHAALEEDLQDILLHVKQHWPHAKILLLGVSLSGNMIVRALGLGLLPEVDAAMAISVPFELQAAAEAVDKGIGRLYRRYLVERMKDIIQLKQDYLTGLRDDVDIKSLHSFWALDNFVVAPLHGFRNVHDYYREASSRQYIPLITQPLLIIQSLDDPLVPSSVWPSSCLLPACVEFEAYDCGGHVGFMNAQGYWLETRVVEWIQTEIECDH